MSAYDDEIKNTITGQEEQQLRRVYNLLCDYHTRAQLKREMAQIDQDMNATKSKRQINGEDRIYHSLETTNLNAEKKLIQAEIDKLELKDNRKIRPVDLGEALRFLGKKCSKEEIKEMIWEVDENLDECIDWSEFRLMFLRNILDRTGLEPSKLYHVVQFMIYDDKETGKVSVDGTMDMLYERYGRARMEEKLRQLFGRANENGAQGVGGGGEIDFFQYLKTMEQAQMDMFMKTDIGRNLQEKSRKKKGSKS